MKQPEIGYSKQWPQHEARILPENFNKNTDLRMYLLRR